MVATCEDGQCARLALAAGVIIERVPGLVVSLAFAFWGEPPRIYIPATWSGPMADDAICGRFAELAAGGRSTGERVAIWRGAVERISGPWVLMLADLEVTG